MNDYIEIPLSPPRKGSTVPVGLVVRVSPEDVDKVKQFRWHAQAHKCDLGVTYYARGYVGGEHVLLHRYLLGLLRGDSRQVDHKDWNGLNCVRSNMRVTDARGNSLNRRKWKKKLHSKRREQQLKSAARTAAFVNKYGLEALSQIQEAVWGKVHIAVTEKDIDILRQTCSTPR